MTMTPEIAAQIDVARVDKAARLAHAMTSDGLTATDAARMAADARRAVEAHAGVRIGSAATWRTALDILAGSVRVDCPTCGHGDPDGAIGPVKPYGHTGPCAR